MESVNDRLVNDAAHCLAKIFTNEIGSVGTSVPEFDLEMQRGGDPSHTTQAGMMGDADNHKLKFKYVAKNGRTRRR